MTQQDIAIKILMRVFGHLWDEAALADENNDPSRYVRCVEARTLVWDRVVATKYEADTINLNTWQPQEHISRKETT